MKRLLLIGFLLCAHGAFAATRCIPNIAKMTCSLIGYVGSSEIESTCTDGSVTTTVRMMAVLASDYGEYAQVSDRLEISDTPTENTHCWCRMLKPALSKWVSTYRGYASVQNCLSNCYLTGYGNSAFRDAIINNLI